MKSEFYQMEYEAWDEGTDNLTLELEGAYLRLCHQMYRRRGAIPNQPNTLARIWRCHPNKVAALLRQLVDADKIQVTSEGHLTQARVTQELDRRGVRSTQAADAGRKGGTQRAQNAANALKTNTPPKADASSLPKPPQASREEKSIEEKNREEREAAPTALALSPAASVPAVAEPKLKKATQLPSDWQPSANDIQFAVDHGLSANDIGREAEKFCDYWHSTDKNHRKRDWPATWRNWIRRAPEFRSQNTGASTRGSALDALDRMPDGLAFAPVNAI